MTVQIWKTMALVTLLSFGVSACGSKHDKDEHGTTITVDAKDHDGKSVQVKADGETGRVAINVPGFDANIKLPKVLLDHENFDIDGVKLYPGSKVDTVNVNADDRGGKHKAIVKIGFSAPSDPATVSAWFQKALADKSIAAKVTGNSLAGTTGDGNAFAIDFAAGAAGKTAGIITIKDETE